MPRQTKAEVAYHPREFLGVSPEDVARLVKSFDTPERRLLPRSHNGKSWAQMSAIQRTKVIKALASKCALTLLLFLGILSPHRVATIVVPIVVIIRAE